MKRYDLRVFDNRSLCLSAMAEAPKGKYVEYVDAQKAIDVLTTNIRHLLTLIEDEPYTVHFTGSKE